VKNEKRKEVIYNYSPLNIHYSIVLLFTNHYNTKINFKSRPDYYNKITAGFSFFHREIEKKFYIKFQAPWIDIFYKTINIRREANEIFNSR
jgi:hypothetical protein